MKALFLDFDGVLNTSLTDAAFTRTLQTDLVLNLASVIAKTNAKIVISSAWRYDGIGEGSNVQVALKKASLCDAIYRLIWNSIVGMTPVLYKAGALRYDEILKYVFDCGVTQFAAVDDDVEYNFGGHRPEWLIQTDDRFGLTSEIAQKLIERLT